MSTDRLARLFIICLTVFAAKGSMAADHAATSGPAISDYTRPISFEPNRGQTDEQVEFLAHGAGYRLFLSHAEAVMALDRGVTVRMRPVGGKPSASSEALEEQPSQSNYFIGNVPEKWHTNIPNYARVRYRNVYRGIDLIYYGNQRQLEYDFVVSPGADPGSILLNFEGAEKASLDPSGDVVMHTAAGNLRWHKPFAYQEVDGSQKIVGCTYRRKAQGLGFTIGAYDRDKPLIIDPVLIYSTYLGGSGDQYGNGDRGNAIAVDANGNAYITGSTYSPDFPTKNPLENFYKGDLVGTSNAFVTKLDAAGRLVYSTYLGGSGNEQSFGSTRYPPQGDVGNGIAVDSYGNAYIAGITGSFDFPLKNPFQTARFFLSGAFLTKLNPAGDALVYSTYLSGDYQDSATAVAVDSHDNVYLTGFSASPDFPTKNAFQTAPAAGFLTKFTAAGTALVYSTYFPATPSAVSVDAYENVYITGATFGGLPVKNAFQSTKKSTCCSNAFVTKFDAAGNALVYSTYLGGSGSDVANGIAVDSGGHAFVTGATTSPNFPTQNPFQHTLKGAENSFVTKFHYAGNSVFYSTYLGGTGSDSGNAIAVDAYDNAYVTGFARSHDFPIRNAFQNTNKSTCSFCSNAFVTEFDAAGTAQVYSSYLGGSGPDSGNGIAVDTHGNAYVTGVTNSIDFPVKDAFQNTLESPGGDAFVAKIAH